MAGVTTLNRFYIDSPGSGHLLGFPTMSQGDMAYCDPEHYAFLAFSYDTGDLLAHAPNAAMALKWADKLAPKDELQVIQAGRFGVRIWDLNLSLPQAWDALEGKWAAGPALGHEAGNRRPLGRVH